MRLVLRNSLSPLQLRPFIAMACLLFACWAPQTAAADDTSENSVEKASAESARFVVVDGDVRAVIVGERHYKPIAELGYWGKRTNPLFDFIYRSTGKPLKIIDEADYDPATMPYAIFTGETQAARDKFGDRLKEMDRDSYLIDVQPTRVIIAGPTDHAAMWGQYGFLQKFVGVDMYMPTVLGFDVPKHKSLTIPVGLHVESPVFMSREISAINVPGQLRGQMHWPLRGYRRFSFSHNIQTFITVKEYGETHPEYFPFINGQRVLTSSAAGPGPCISNPDVVKIIIDKVNKYFDEHPQTEVLSMGMTDGGYCQCDECKAMDQPSIEIDGDISKMSGRYYSFLNKVAGAIKKTHPGKYIGTIGYAGCDLPPQFPVERNIMVYMCYSRFNWNSPSIRARDLKVADAWLERLDRVGIYEYAMGAGYSIPRLNPHHLAEFMRYVADRSTKGSGFYCEMYSNHGLDGPKAWMMDKLMWNPHEDVDALLKQWCDAMFKSASEPMEKYFKLLEQIPARNAHLLKEPMENRFWSYGKDMQFQLFLPADMDELQLLLQEAKTLAVEPVAAKRVAYFADTLRITDACVRTYHAYHRAFLLTTWNPAYPRRILGALLGGDLRAPDVQLPVLMDEIIKSDSTKFVSGPLPGTDALIVAKVIKIGVWPALREALASGERDPAVLQDKARQTFAEVAKGLAHSNKPKGEERLKQMANLAAHIALAKHVTTPPVIDGDTSDAQWQWNNPDELWFRAGTAKPLAGQASYALVYDEKNLYVALRCEQSDLESFASVTGEQTPAWKYPGLDFLISQDAEAGSADRYAYNQMIIGKGGGTFEFGKPRAVVQKASKTHATSMEFEFTMSFEKLGFTPDKLPYVRFNIIHNMNSNGQQPVATWYVSPGAHKSADARGWLIFEPVKK